jgi:hypothetical protein
MDIYKYIRYFLLGGFGTIFVNYLIENYEEGPALSAYLYCAPTIYLIILYIIYKDKGVNEYYTFIVQSIINYTANIFILIFLVFLTKYISSNVYLNFSLITILFIYYSIYYFLYLYKLKFIP